MKDIPLLTTLHDAVPVSSLRKTMDDCGARILVAWEQLKTQAIEEEGLASDAVETVHIGMNPDHFAPCALKKKSSRPVLSLMSDLTGPGGDAALKMMQEVFEFNKYEVRVIGADRLPAEFSEFENSVELKGAGRDIRTYLAESDVVVASGSSAIEALMMGRPVVAVGKAGIFGLVDEDNLDCAIGSGFGEITCKDRSYLDYEAMRIDIDSAIARRYVSDEVHETIVREFNLKTVADRMENIYKGLVGDEEE